MRIMKFWTIALLMVILTLPAMAQTNLVGRVYSNDNIMKKELDEATKDMDKKMSEAKTKAVTEAEKKKGRKLTAAEMTKIDNEVKETRSVVEAMKKGMKTAINFEFKTDNQVVMHVKMSINDDALKAAGVGWLKRKALKAALAVAPSSHKMKYLTKDDLIICIDGKDKDTLRLSKDQQLLYGKMDEKTPFTLKRTK